MGGRHRMHLAFIIIIIIVLLCTVALEIPIPSLICVQILDCHCDSQLENTLFPFPLLFATHSIPSFNMNAQRLRRTDEGLGVYLLLPVIS
jgi:hypothetical protein